jgi:hypothetical protein
MSSQASSAARAVLEPVVVEAARLRLRLLGLALTGALLVGGSIVTAFLIAPEAQVEPSEVQPPSRVPLVAFVLGFGAVIGAGVTLLRLSGANERAGAAARLLEGHVPVRSTRSRRSGNVALVALVFEDGHRGELELGLDALEPVEQLAAERRGSRDQEAA